MNSLFERYKALPIDGALLSLERHEEQEPYFCYPLHAEAIGYEGSILYCFIDGYGEMVFAANPESCAEQNVYPLAASFEDFLRLILACGSANPVEQIVWMDREQFQQHLRESRDAETDRQREALSLLARELELTPLENSFAYVKAVQENFDGSKIQYRNAYYDAMGMERPDGSEPEETGFEFQPITFQFDKK